MSTILPDSVVHDRLETTKNLPNVLFGKEDLKSLTDVRIYREKEVEVSVGSTDPTKSVP